MAVILPCRRTGVNCWRLLTASLCLWLGLAILPVQAAAPKKVTVAMSLTPLSAPVIIAKKNGYFAENGLDVITDDYIGGARAIRAIFQGKADISTSSEVVVMFNSFARSDFVVLCTFVTSDNDVKIIARRDSGIRKLADLADHRVGTITGASAQFFLDETLLLAGVDASRVNVVHVDPENIPTMLAQAHIDAAVGWEPSAYLAKKLMGGDAVEIAHEKIYTETFNAVIMKDFARKNPDVQEKFLRALIKATAFIRTHPEQSQKIVAARIKQSPELVAAVWADLDFSINLHQWLLTTLEKQARWAIGRHLVSKQEIPNYLDFLNLAPLTNVQPRAVTVFR